MPLTIDMLNESQRQAVEWENGALLVLAGPGSGKTAVLTLRIANLIKNSHEASYRILGLTFTVKAASEMQARINELLGEDNRRVQLKTIHSFCADLLRQHGSHLGLRPDFSVITDDVDRISILKKIKDDSLVDLDSPEDALKKIDLMFTHGISSEELPSYFGDDKGEQCRALQAIFKSYMDELVAGNQLDFGSMLYFARKLLEAVPRVARQVQTVYRYICVDEFQDTNLAQYKILKLLAATDEANMFVVADDDQIIFQWNGADPQRLSDLKTDFQPEVIQLPENYRCPQEVVEIANKLIKHNSNRLEAKKVSVSHNHAAGVVQLSDYPDFESELAGLIGRIKEIPKNKRESCVVIARSNKLLTQVQVAMASAGVNAEIVSKHQDFSSPVMLTIYLSLKLANAPDSRSILNKLCSVTSSITGSILSAEDIVAKARVMDMPILRSYFNSVSSVDTLIPFGKAGLEQLCDSMNYSTFSTSVLEHFGQLNTNENGDDLYPDFSDDRDNWLRISGDIKRVHGDAVSLHVFLQEMDLSPKTKPLGTDCVRLQTVHTAKGMEFDNVYVIGLAEEQFPSYYAIKNGDNAIQEERRSCFVAITRASKNLYLSYAKKYSGWGKQPSRFLKEMDLLNDL